MPSEPKFVFGQVSCPQPEEVDETIDILTARFAIHCRHNLLNRMMDHAVLFRDTETFGLLLGRALRTPSGRLRTLVEDYITPTELEVSTRTFVEVSARELMRMDTVYQESALKTGFLKVGWFHTHPGHGIFMSETDRQNHALYHHPWQVALVLDPHSQESGFFVGPEYKRIECIVDEDLLSTPYGITGIEVPHRLDQTGVPPAALNGVNPKQDAPETPMSPGMPQIERRGALLARVRALLRRRA